MVSSPKPELQPVTSIVRPARSRPATTSAAVVPYPNPFGPLPLISAASDMVARVHRAPTHSRGVASAARHRRASGANSASGSALPRTGIGSNAFHAKRSPMRSRVADETSRGVPAALVSPSMREATLTVSPIAV